jgi:hypothetical protein
VNIFKLKQNRNGLRRIGGGMLDAEIKPTEITEL